ncbi:hypothetical protein IJJ12_00910 [bacterium]|nr:hypothetical protein [bacterium]
MALAGRVAYPLTNSFAFVFDHGKDSLNVMEMLLTHRPKLIGPWTSIPGFYFGPVWYYMLAACYLVGAGQPVAAVWGMIGLAVVMVALTYRYFGRLAATMVATGTAWVTITVSAWNPYPLPLVSLLLLILLKKTATDHNLSLKRAFWFGLLAALGCHFSTAYAIFYPIIILLCWLKQRLIINYKVILCAILGFAVPCLPQAFFEVRHDFGEVRAVWTYISETGARGGDSLSWGKVQGVVGETLGQVRLLAFPDIQLPDQLGTVASAILAFFGCVWLAVAIAAVAKHVKNKAWPTDNLWVECLIFILLPTTGFLFLHFNVWYLLGMAPAVVILVAWPVREYRWAAAAWAGAMIVGLVTHNAWEFVWNDVSRVGSFYAQVNQVWEDIKVLAGDKNFAVYTYEGAIYDFNYQYLMLRDAWKEGRPLPVEFSYAPGETAYVPMKEALLARLPQQSGPVETVFYIIIGREKASDYFLAWQDRQEYLAGARFIEQVGENLELWQAENIGEATFSAEIEE